MKSYLSTNLTSTVSESLWHRDARDQYATGTEKRGEATAKEYLAKWQTGWSKVGGQQ